MYTICVVEPGADTEPENEPVNEVAFMLPFTSNLAVGLIVPIPTFPLPSIKKTFVVS